MAITQFTGFNLGTGEPSQANGGTFSIQGTTVKTGTYALQCNPTTTGVGWWRLGSLEAPGYMSGQSIATAFCKFDFQVGTAPSTNDETFFETQDFSGGLPKLQLRLNSTRNIVAYNSAGSAMATGATVLSLNTWYAISCKSGTGASASWEVQINGVSEISGTGNLQTNNNSTFAMGKPQNSNNRSVNFYYDNFIVDDTSYPASTSVVYISIPISNGTTFTWTAGTAANYTATTEIPANGDTSYIANLSALSQQSLVNFQSSTTIGMTTGTIKSVKLSADIRTITGSTSFHVRLLSGATTSDTTADTLSTSYDYRQKIYNTDPNGSISWTSSAYDALQGGVLEDTVLIDRCTQIMLEAVNDGIAVSSVRMLACAGAGT